MPTDYFFKQGKSGILMLHGFTANPNELLELGEGLAQEGFIVSIPVLPGHGTHSADLLNYTWRDWFNCAKQAYSDLEKVCSQVAVCGLSMGGTLALHLASHLPVKAVVTLSAPVFFPSWQQVAVKTIKRLRRFRKKHGGADVRDVAAKTKLQTYQRFPYRAVEQLFALTNHVRDDLPDINQPILSIHSRMDHTIPFKNLSKIIDSVSSPLKRSVILEKSFHIISVDVEKDVVRGEVSSFLNEHLLKGTSS